MMQESVQKRKLAILGSTGSIGRQALDVVRQHKDLFQIELLLTEICFDFVKKKIWNTLMPLKRT